MASDLTAVTSRLEDLERRYEITLRDLRRLQDIEDIRQLKYRYFRAIDSGDSALLRETVTEDFKCRFKSDAWEFSSSNRSEFVELLSLFANNQMAIQHQGHHPEITIDDDNSHASGIWYLQDIVHNVETKLLMAGTCFYHDRYLRTEKGWKIQSSHWDRHVEINNTIDFVPNYTGRYLKTHGRKPL